MSGAPIRSLEPLVLESPGVPVVTLRHAPPSAQGVPTSDRCAGIERGNKSLEAAQEPDYGRHAPWGNPREMSWRIARSRC